MSDPTPHDPEGHQPEPADHELVRPEADEPGHPEPAAAPELALDQAVLADGQWRRLSLKTMLSAPVEAAMKSIIPLALAVAVYVRTGEFQWWMWIVGVAIVLVLPLWSLAEWYVVRYRVTSERLERRSALFSRKVTTARLDRIRTVDLEATVIHRIVGLRKVQVGTGADENRIVLDSLDTASAEVLREELLAHSRARRAALQAADGTAEATAPVAEATDPDDASTNAPSAPGTPHDNASRSTSPATTPPATTESSATVADEPERELSRFDTKWLIYAPLGFSGLVVVGAVFGALWQFGGDMGLFDSLGGDDVASAWEFVSRFGLALALVLALAAVIVGWLLFSTLTYITQWWGLVLTRQGGQVHSTRGLFTQKSVSVEEKRLRGVIVSEPLQMRWASGASLTGVATGVGLTGETPLLPPVPLAEARRVAGEVMDAESGALTTSMTPHGPMAKRRRYVRGQWLTLLVAAALGVASVWLDLPWWAWVSVPVLAVLGVLVAADRYRSLGHALTDHHIVIRSGSFLRRRIVLDRDGIVAWDVRATWFQRRLGLVTLIAATAAGTEQYAVVDIPRDDAVAFAEAATPGWLPITSREPVAA